MSRQNGNSNTSHYDSVLVGTGKQKGLESLSENREWRCRCNFERQIVTDGGARNHQSFSYRSLLL